MTDLNQSSFHRISREKQPILDQPVKPTRKRSRRGLLAFILLVLFFLFFTPFRTNLLVIGIDRTPEGTAIGRSDTMVLASLPPITPKMRLLSIPRDLWVTVPGYGENRINTAHYFAELDSPGSGPRAARQVVETNFGVQVPYSIRLKFDGFVKIVDAMGGVTLNLAEPAAGLEAGRHTLDGTQALAFVRSRSGSDDFFRQQHAQLFIAAALKNMLNPVKWARLPQILAALTEAVDTNLPIWLWPRVLYGTGFSAVTGFDSQAISREMVTPWTTEAGAQVLLPNWDMINPLIEEKFQ